jgi:hypothetical protein
MITSADFGKITYKNPEKALRDQRDAITKIIGFDSEAYTTGEPFMFTTSLQEVILPMQMPDVLFEEKYVEANFMLYNMKYDSGAILYHLEQKDLFELWEQGSVKAGDFRYQYIPHKRLVIQHGKQRVTFWDIAQFFKHGARRLSLDKAAQTYLDEHKLPMRTKRFTPELARKWWKAISKYGIQDAVLTGKLGSYLVKKLDEFGITPTAIYSCASISFKYFCDRSTVVTAWRW